MISREEAKKYIEDTFVFLAISDAFSTVDKIYDSRGSCGECKYYGYESRCTKHKDFHMTKKPNGYCDDFERKEDDTNNESI